jgi:hypothetical protein
MMVEDGDGVFCAQQPTSIDKWRVHLLQLEMGVKLSNGRVSDKPRRLPRHQRAQAHNSTHYRQQLSFLYWLCSNQNCLLCAYEHDFGDNYLITIVKTGLTTTKCVIVLSVLNLVSDIVKCNHPIENGHISFLRE